MGDNYHMNRARGMRAYLRLAKPLPWEEKFYDLPHPNKNFASQAQELRLMTVELQDALQDLQSKDYLGVGNDRVKLETTIDQLKRKSELRDEQELLFQQYRTKELVKAVRSLKGERTVPTSRDLGKMSKTELVLLLTETLNESIEDIHETIQTVPRLRPPPPSPQSRFSPSRRRPSPQSASQRESASDRPALLPERYTIDEYGTLMDESPSSYTDGGTP